MDNNQTYNKDTFIGKLNNRRLFFVAFCLLIAAAFPAGFFIYTVSETLSFNNLDQERYTSRMNDSYLFAFILFGFCMLIIAPAITIINKMCKRYFEVIKTLSIEDTKKLFVLNEMENFIYKYMPSYIIKGDTVTFFSMFKQNSIDFKDVLLINIQQTNSQEYNAVVNIETAYDKYTYTLTGNSFKVRNLMAEAMRVNPSISNH